MRRAFDRRLIAPKARSLEGAPLVIVGCGHVARGAVIDQVALIRALQSGRIGGAGLEVTDPEPVPATDPMWVAPNLLISPQFAGSGTPQRGPAGRRRGRRPRRLMSGQPLQHVVSG